MGTIKAIKKLVITVNIDTIYTSVYSIYAVNYSIENYTFYCTVSRGGMMFKIMCMSA